MNLYVINGNTFVFNVDNWCELRKTHRIIGEIVGNTFFVPSLPMKLLPEEVIFLVERGIASVYQVDDVPCCDNETLLNELLEHEKIEYKKIRRKQLESMLDKIVEKRRKCDDLRTPEEILQEELEKSCTVDKNNLIWPIFLERNLDGKDLNSVALEEIKKRSNKLKTLVYKDLWEKGYFITHGNKFGGDFLVYNGDPVAYHAMFIVRCVDKNQPISPHEIVAFGRLGTSVKKRAVVASILEDDVVSYVTINWIDA